MLDDVEAVKDHPCLRSLLPTTVMYGSHMSMLTASSSAALCGPSLRKNRQQRLALRSFPAQTTPAAEMVYYHC